MTMIRRQKFLLIACAALTLIIAGITWVWLRPHDPIPTDIRQSANFSLYYPTKLPKDLMLDKGSFSYGNKVVAFVVKSGDKKIFVTEQAKPADFNFEQFYQDKLDESTEFTTTYGKAASGTVNQNTRVVSLVTNGTWVFLNTMSDVSFDQLEVITKALVKS